MMVRVEGGGGGVYRGRDDGIDLLGLPGRGWGVEQRSIPSMEQGHAAERLTASRRANFTN